MSKLPPSPSPTAPDSDGAEALRALEDSLRSVFNAYRKHQGTQQRDSERNYRLTRLATIVGLGVFIAATVQAYLTIHALNEATRAADAAVVQARIARLALAEARKSGEEATRLARLSQRAFLGSLPPHLDWSARVVYIPITNAGWLPARNVRANVVELRLRGRDILQGSQSQGFTTLPIITQGLPYSLAVKLPKMSNDERDVIINGDVTLLLAGTIIYNTGFDDDDVTEFCVTYSNVSPTRWMSCTNSSN